jgi:2-C-methyl-D-erythritol 4-phosphate cytidylyltransferase
VSALIVAAGRGRRLGGRRPKQFVRVGGRSLVERCLRIFEATRAVDEIWLVLPPGRLRAASLLRRRYPKLRGAVAGGRQRGDSVRRGLRRLGGDGIVLVHDAARPMVPRAVIERVARAARRHGAAVPALPVGDTLKRAGHAGRVAATLARSGVWAAQTPQGFRVDVLRRAYAAGAAGRAGRATDDASRVERLGRRVALVEGSPLAFKITRPEDLRLARLLARAGV